MKYARFRSYLVVFVILGLGLIVVLASRFKLTVQVEPTLPQADQAIAPSPELPRANPLESAPTVTPITPTPQSTQSPQLTPSPNLIRQGRLRVSNQTEHPIRVTLLYKPVQPSTQSSEAPQPNNASSYSEPVHWDFAPQEGSTKGLLLSLPNTDLKLQSGDVLAAFAQDGSRRYWGPYVVGETTAPIWNVNEVEWQLILQPKL